MRSITRLVASCLGVLLLSSPVHAQADRAGTFGATHGAGIVVPGELALGSLIALSDGYLQKFADSLSLFALTPEARSADWAEIKPPLAALALRNVDALVWFALPTGNYWSVEGDFASGNLADRPYFPIALAGHTVIGTLVVSRATGKSSAIVAVPVRGDGGAVVGVLGASVYLDKLSARLENDIGIGDGMIFYSFDATPLLALEWDPQLILVDPLSLGPEITAVFEYMLQRSGGSVRYRWNDRWRTVIFRRSPVTGWWYVFGIVGGRSFAAGAR